MPRPTDELIDINATRERARQQYEEYLRIRRGEPRPQTTRETNDVVRGNRVYANHAIEWWRMYGGATPTFDYPTEQEIQERLQEFREAWRLTARERAEVPYQDVTKEPVKTLSLKEVFHKFIETTDEFDKYVERKERQYLYGNLSNNFKNRLLGNTSFPLPEITENIFTHNFNSSHELVIALDNSWKKMWNDLNLGEYYNG